MMALRPAIHAVLAFALVLAHVAAAAPIEDEPTFDHGQTLSSWFHQAKMEAHNAVLAKLSEQASRDLPNEAGRRLLAAASFDPKSVLGTFNAVASSKTSVDLTGIVTAFTPEITQLVKAMTGKVMNVTRAGRKFIIGSVDGKPLVATVCGQGMTNAAMTTMLMAQLFPVKRIIFSGIAGAVDPKIRVGDVVIPVRWTQYQYMKYVKKAAKDPGYTDFAIDFPNKFYTVNGKVPAVLYSTTSNVSSVPKDGVIQKTKTGSFLRLSKFAVPTYVDTLTKADDGFVNTPQQFWFEIDPKLKAAAIKAIKKKIVLGNTGFDPINQKNFTLPYKVKVEMGNAGVSGTTFMDNAEFRQQTFKTYNAQVVDMESAGFMHACKSIGLPCMVIRSASDLAGGGEGLNVVLTFLNFAATNSVRTLRAILKEL